MIGGSIGGVNRLGAILFEFDPWAVTEAFDGRWSEMLDVVEATLKPKGKGAPRQYLAALLLFGDELRPTPRRSAAMRNALLQWVEVFDNDGLDPLWWTQGTL